MADNEFQAEAIGGVYAHALINEAQKRGILAEITEDVRAIRQLLQENAGFRAFTEALTIGDEERLASLQKIFSGRVHQLIIEVLKSMARRDRLMFLPGFAQAFEDMLRKLSGHVDVAVVSAVALRPELVARLTRAVGASLGKTPDVTVRVDPALIGGITITIDDLLIDGSVTTQLKRLKDQLRAQGAGQINLPAMMQ